IFTRQSTMAPSTGTLPPESPVPLPRVTTGVLCARAYLRVLLISSAFMGKATTAGKHLGMPAVPSNAYMRRSLGSVNNRSAGKISESISFMRVRSLFKVGKWRVARTFHCIYPIKKVNLSKTTDENPALAFISSSEHFCHFLTGRSDQLVTLCGKTGQS